jgi:hypothetical protein
MAAQSYYSNNGLTADQQQQQHLLSPALSSPGFSAGHSSGQSSPLKPMHLVTDMNTSYHGHDQGFDDFDHIKSAQVEDEVS